MTTQESDSQASPPRIDIIEAVKTPLGFFTLVVLVVEVILGITANFSEGSDRTYLILGMIGLIFLLVLIVAALAVFRPEALTGLRPAAGQPEPLPPDTAPIEEKIARLEQMIEMQIRNELLDNFIVPKGFRPEVSKEFRFGFCYPESWELLRYPQETIYGSIRDMEHGERTGFARNFNVIVVDISQADAELADLYRAAAEWELYVAANSEPVFAEPLLFHGLEAFKHRFNWTDNAGNQMTAYQILVADAHKKNLFKITFTTIPDDFDTSRPVFDNIASTFRV